MFILSQATEGTHVTILLLPEQTDQENIFSLPDRARLTLTHETSANHLALDPHIQLKLHRVFQGSFKVILFSATGKSIH